MGFSLLTTSHAAEQSLPRKTTTVSCLGVTLPHSKKVGECVFHDREITVVIFLLTSSIREYLLVALPSPSPDLHPFLSLAASKQGSQSPVSIRRADALTTARDEDGAASCVVHVPAVRPKPKACHDGVNVGVNVGVKAVNGAGDSLSPLQKPRVPPPPPPRSRKPSPMVLAAMRQQGMGASMREAEASSDMPVSPVLPSVAAVQPAAPAEPSMPPPPLSAATPMTPVGTEQSEAPVEQGDAAVAVVVDAQPPTRSAVPRPAPLPTPHATAVVTGAVVSNSSSNVSSPAVRRSIFRAPSAIGFEALNPGALPLPRKLRSRLGSQASMESLLPQAKPGEAPSLRAVSETETSSPVPHDSAAPVVKDEVPHVPGVPAAETSAGVDGDCHEEVFTPEQPVRDDSESDLGATFTSEPTSAIDVNGGCSTHNTEALAAQVTAQQRL